MQVTYEVTRIKCSMPPRSCEACKSRKARVYVTWFGMFQHTSLECVKCATFKMTADVSNGISRLITNPRTNKKFNVAFGR